MKKKVKGKGGGSPSTTINNNNIVININKSYNMKENERKVPLTDGISRMLESPVDELENQQNFDMNEKSMNDALLREIEKRAK